MLQPGGEYQRNRTTLSVSGRWEKDLYDRALLLDNTRSGAEFRVDRKLTRALTAEGSGVDTTKPTMSTASSPGLNRQRLVLPTMSRSALR